jgi:3-oxoadipate enol-lactonase
MAAIAEETLTRWFTPLTAAERPALVQSARQMILATPPDGYRGCCGALEKLDYLNRLGTMRVPVLYLAGEADPAAPPAAMEDMAKATPGGQFVILPKAAHLSNLEEPVAFAAAVLRFLELDEG